VSTAQALNAGMPSAPAPTRTSDARRADDGLSFRDTLDSAERSQEPVSQDAGSKVSRQKATSEATPRDDERASVESDASESADGDEEAGSLRSEQATSDWALILAALSGTSSDGGKVVDFATALERARPKGLTGPAFGGLGSGAAGEVKGDATGVAMAGIAGEADQVIDVGALLDLLKSRADAAAGVEPNPVAAAGLEGVKVEEIKATVLGQETHLALEPTPAETMARIMDPAAAEATGDAQPPKPDGANAEAAQNVAAGDALDVLDRRPAPPPESRSTQSGTSDGRVWQEGAGPDAVGQQTARGAQSQHGQSSGGGQGNGQGGSSIFAAFADGGPRATAAASDAGDDFESYVPVSDQIAAEVRAEVAADGLGERSSDGVLKVLQIELKPANLGSVTVRIALKDNQITLHLETQRRETLAAIERDRDALAGALSSAGYTVDGITTASQSDAARSSTTFTAVNGGVGADAGAAAQQQSAGQSPGNSSSGQRDSGQAAAQGSDYRPAAGKDDGTSGARRVSDGLYV
jgi:chemotaxis protein MotD